MWSGTDATIHEHIKKVLEREYVVKTERDLLAPTSLGVALVEGYDSMGFGLSKPTLRAKVRFLGAILVLCTERASRSSYCFRLGFKLVRAFAHDDDDDRASNDQTEADMKDISIGRKSKRHVVQTSLAFYRRILEIALQLAFKVDAV